MKLDTIYRLAKAIAGSGRKPCSWRRRVPALYRFITAAPENRHHFPLRLAPGGGQRLGQTIRFANTLLQFRHLNLASKLRKVAEDLGTFQLRLRITCSRKVRYGCRL